MDHDARISRLSRALSRAEQEDTFTGICAQIQELMENADNRRYVARSFNALLPSLDSTFKMLTGVKWPNGIQTFAELLAKIANSVEGGNVKFFPWIFESMDRENLDVRSGDMVAVVQDVFFKMIPLLSSKTSHTLVADIHEVMNKERFQSADAFKALCSAFVKVLGLGATCSTPAFQEFIDVVIGWMVDEEQSENKTYSFCAEVLLKLQSHFEYDPAFTAHLLSLILEDFEDAVIEVQTNNGLKKLTRIVLLVKAFSTISSIPCKMELATKASSSDKFMKNVIQVLSITHLPETNDYVVFRTKKQIIHCCMEYLSKMGFVDTSNVRLFIKELLQEGLENISNNKVAFPMLRDLSTGLNTWLQAVSVNPNVDEECLEIIGMFLKFCDWEFVHIGVDDPLHMICCIHSCLRSRNVVILQKVYTWLVNKCDLSSSDRIFKSKTRVVCTVLLCLSDIASSKANSILTRWAFDPPIFNLLMTLFVGVRDQTVQLTLLSVLKTHCLCHSHFVSSVFSPSFAAEAPTSNSNLLTLMEFWINILTNYSLSLAKVVLEWITVFVKTSSSYSKLLSEEYITYYQKFLEIPLGDSKMFLEFSKLLRAILVEPAYFKTRVHGFATKATINLMSRAKELNQETIQEIFSIFDEGNALVIVKSDFALCPNTSSCNNTRDSLCSEIDSSEIIMTAYEFEEFISNLLRLEVREQDFNYQQKTITDAVGILVRSKLKSFLGKPADLFGQLQTLFKKYRILKSETVPAWKLEFVYHLDVEIHLAMQESLVIHSSLTDALKNFYATNRTPCTEWLKRLRLDVSEVALQTGNNELAFLFSGLASDDVRAKRAAFCLKDADTLRSMQELILSHYINGKFEEVLVILEKVQDNDEFKYSLDNCISGTCKTLTGLAAKSLTDWVDKDVSQGNKDVKCAEAVSHVSSDCKEVNILSNKIYGDSLDRKTSLLVIGDTEVVCDIHTTLKLASQLKREKQVPIQLLHEVKILEADRLLQLGNVNLVKDIFVDDILKCDEKTEFSAYCLNVSKIQADISFLEGRVETSANMYIDIMSSLENTLDNFSDKLKSEVVLGITSKMVANEDFLNIMGKRLQSETTVKPQLKMVHSEFRKHLNSSPNDSECWFAFGNYLYESSQRESFEVEPLKTEAVECFSQYLNLHQPQKNVDYRRHRYWTKKPEVINSMVKLLHLHQQGYKLESDRVFVNRDWLTMLPSLCQVEEFHRTLFQRFPQHVGFHLASQQAVQREHYKSCIKDRKTLFDTDSYGFYEFNEDINKSVKLCEKYRFSFDQSALPSDTPKYQSAMSLPDEITTIFKELQRIGSSKEDQWIYAFQKLHGDWHKRITCLKDDIARDGSPDLLKSYSLPVAIYFEELFKISQTCDTPSDVLFLVRHKASIIRIISQFRSSQSLEELLETYAELSKLVNEFSSSIEPKVLVGFLSPTLAKFDFQSSSFKFSLPGVPANITIIKVDQHAQILATKTRPKRLTFRGSDGKPYSYLVKGNENLNVDAGVMQYMNMMEHLVKWPSRSYSVTPLGKKGGIIQLVTNTTPLFHLYKKFLQKNGIEERTTDLFWSRMNSLGYSDRTNHVALKQVFEQLQKETPSDILAKELHLSATNPRDWYNCIHTITTDCAMGSAIGYILGIGDRHLDNILIDLKAGYFIHVDFSLVFGKGATLRVPEKVPFRLTQNISAALKYPGRAGSFKVLLEKFICSMKSHKAVTLYGVQHIAEACGISDDLPVNLLPILKAELNSAAFILKSRQNNIIRPGSILKADLLDMCKELNVATTESANLHEKVAQYSKTIEHLTVALTVLRDTKSDSNNLSSLRKKCDYINKKSEVFANVAAFREKLQKGFCDINASLKMREELINQTDKSSELLQKLQINMPFFPQTEVWRDTMQFFQEAIELADVALTFSWVSLRHPITCHPITRVLEALRDTSETNLTIYPLTGCHTEKSADGVWNLLNTDLITIQDQIVKLRGVLTSHGITDIESEIKKTEVQCASTEETLSRYTLLSPSNSSTTSDMDVFLKFAIPCVERALGEPNTSYDFIVKMLLLTQNASKFSIPCEIYSVLESLISLHVKARDNLCSFLDGHFDSFSQDGYKVVLTVHTVLQAVLSETIELNFTRDNLLDEWNVAMSNLKSNFESFKVWLTGESVSNFDITGDVITTLLCPISNFTLPLTKECQLGIIRMGKQLLNKFSLYGTAYHSDDPLAVLLTELKGLESRVKFLKDLRYSLDGCESAALFLAAEKDRFEWAFHQLLPTKNIAIEKRLYELNRMVVFLETFTSKGILCEGLSGIKDHHPNNQALLQEMYSYMRSLYKFVTAVVTFETNRFNSQFTSEYVEIQEQIAGLKLLNEVPDFEEEEFGSAEKFIATSTGIKQNKKYPHTATGDKNWATAVEKSLTSRLQTEIQNKKMSSEILLKSNSSDKLIASRMSRIVNRWRRVLANLHPTIMFIFKYAKGTTNVNVYKMTIDNDWIPRVARFWLFQSEDKQLEDPEALLENFDLSEKILRILVDTLEDAKPIQINDELVGPYSTLPATTSNLVKYSEDRVDTFSIMHSVEWLIAEAIRPETLSKMYEGWSAWV